MKFITICKAMHAPLYKRYDLKVGDFVTVGNVEGTYGREDGETGAEYKCLSCWKSKRGKVPYSSDFKVGSFYPENIFIWGKDENNSNLTHEQIEGFCKQLRYNSTRRVILPNGFNKGQTTWNFALMYSPVERKPNWSSLPAILTQQFSNVQISVYDNRIDIDIEQ